MALSLLLLLSLLPASSSEAALVSPTLCAGLIGDFSALYNLEYITLDLTNDDAQQLLLIRRHLRKYVTFQSATHKGREEDLAGGNFNHSLGEGIIMTTLQIHKSTDVSPPSLLISSMVSE